MLQDNGHGPAQLLAYSACRHIPSLKLSCPPRHGCHLCSQSGDPGWTPLSPLCNRDGQKCPGGCWCWHSPASQDSGFQSHLFLLVITNPALAGAPGGLPDPRLSHGVVFGAERGEVSPGAVPTLPSLCWGHEWGWLACQLLYSEDLRWSYLRRISCRSVWGRSTAGLPREVLQPCTRQVASSFLSHSCWGSHAHAGAPRTFGLMVRCLAIP